MHQNETGTAPKLSFNRAEHLNKIAYSNNISLLKKLIWTYFILLIFEGALRKWVLPGLAAPLLIVRDPVAIWMLMVAWKSGILKSNIYLSVNVVIGTLALITALLFGHGNLLVALYGIRTLLLHFVVIFIMGAVLTRRDVLKIGTVMLWMTIPMTVLLLFQFYSPQSAWVNLGVGGDTAGGGFSGALGFFRPPGTFSFTSGTVLFYSLSACFIFYFWLAPGKTVNRPLLIVASAALCIAIPIALSRTLFFSIIFTLLFVVLALLRNIKKTGRVVVAGAVVLTVFVILSQLNFFNTAIEAFTSRFEDASIQEGGLTGTVNNRFLGGLLAAFDVNADLPFFGYGIGMGTNVGSQLLTGEVQFLVAEGEWGRLIGEMGLVLGTAAIIVRLGLTIKMTLLSFKKLSVGDFLPWILTSYCFFNVPQGQWAQPTTLGFSVFVAGLTIASFANPGKAKDEIPQNMQPATSRDSQNIQI